MCTTCRDSDEPQAVTTNWQRAFTVQEMMEGQPQCWAFSLQPIKIHVSQETLAEMIGTTRSRVSYFMNKFRKLGFISYNGKIEVHNSLLNAVLHDTPKIQRD